MYLADVEGEEMLVPVVHLLLGRLPDSGGAGKYRGGPTNVNIGMVHGSDDVQLQFKGQQSKLAVSQGLFGGYPSGAKQVKVKRDTNLLNLIAQGQAFPLGEDEEN